MKKNGRAPGPELIALVLVLGLLSHYGYEDGTPILDYLVLGPDSLAGSDLSSQLNRGSNAGDGFASPANSLLLLNHPGSDRSQQDKKIEPSPARSDAHVSSGSELLFSLRPNLPSYILALCMGQLFISGVRAQEDADYIYQSGKVKFEASETVTGIGFTNVRRQLESPEKDILSRLEHGSGPYSSNAITEYYSVNTSIIPDDISGDYGDYGDYGPFLEYADELLDAYSDYGYLAMRTNNLSASYRATSLPMPHNRSIDFTTRWSEVTRGFSYLSGVSLLESYRQADKIDESIDVNVDEADVDAEFATDFRGSADIRHKSPVSDSQDRYAGSFKLQEDVSYDESISSSNGTGFVDIDKRIKSEGFQRTYEHGSGDFSLSEQIIPARNYIEKEISLIYKPAKLDIGSGNSLHQTLKWGEGVTTKGADIGQVSERFSNLERLEKNTIVTDLATAQTEASYTGRGEFQAAEEANDFIDIEEYTGNYSIQRKVAIVKYPRYNRPHVFVTKEAYFDPSNCRLIGYNITVLNDGNSQLGPIYVKDTFPYGTAFVATSAPPIELTSRYANWSIDEDLSPAESVSIQLLLRIEREVDKLTNRARATAYYLDKSDRLLRTASDYSSTIPLNLSNCVPQDLSLSMRADKNSSYPNIINYQLILDNQADDNISVNLTANLPPGAELLSSPQKPKIVGKDSVTWSFKLNSGRKRTTRYVVNVPGSGLVAVKAIATALSLDGQRRFSAEAATSVLIPKPEGLFETRIINDWLPGDLYESPPVPCGSGSCPLLWEPNEMANSYPPIKLIPTNPGYRKELPCC